MKTRALITSAGEFITFYGENKEPLLKITGELISTEQSPEGLFCVRVEVADSVPDVDYKNTIIECGTLKNKEDDTNI